MNEVTKAVGDFDATNFERCFTRANGVACYNESVHIGYSCPSGTYVHLFLLLAVYNGAPKLGHYWDLERVS